MLNVDDREALECGGLDAAFLFLDLSTNRGIGKRRQDRRTPKAAADFDF
jgi:hypothetical protein